MEYKILVKEVTNPSYRDAVKAAEELESEVKEHLATGWEPIGGVTIGSAGTSPYMLQALIKR